MKRPLLVLALLPLAARALGAQAVAEGSQGASGGAPGENNTLNLADARAAIYLADNDSLLAGDVLDILGLIPDGKGLKGSALGAGGFYLGGPFGSHFSLGLSAPARGYGGGAARGARV